MDSINAMKCEIFTPFGQRLKESNEWYPQDLCNDWSTHQASALSLGESSVVKLGLNFPLRTGSQEWHHAKKQTEQVEKVVYLEKKSKNTAYHGLTEELYLSENVCVVSSGPAGGTSKLQGLYRPLLSFGTGSAVRDVVKVCFKYFDEKQNDETFICLAEGGGISMYCESSSESHVCHVPEFRIGSILPCAFGLLVIPHTELEDVHEKGLYILSHPIKQVSKLWLKTFNQEFNEYNSEEETLVEAEGDILIFWNLVQNKILLRRLNWLSNMDVHGTRLNFTVSRGDISSRLLAQNSHNTPSIVSQYSRYHQKKPAPVRVANEGGSVTYWPTFDFSEATGRALGIGFYPPHMCIFDDPELCLATIFQIDLAKGQWKKPEKIQLSYHCGGAENVGDSNLSSVAIWYLIKSNLFVHSVDIESGRKLAHYTTKNVCDFNCTRRSDGLGTLVTLGTNGKLQLAWVDPHFKIVGSVEIMADIPKHCVIQSIDTLLFNDTIICTTKSITSQDKEVEVDSQSHISSEKLKIQLVDWRKNILVYKAMDVIYQSTSNGKLVSKIISKLIGFGEVKSFDKQWRNFMEVLLESINAEPVGEQFQLQIQVVQALENLMQSLQLFFTYGIHVGLLQEACFSIHQSLQLQFPKEPLPQKRLNLFCIFGNLLHAQLWTQKSKCHEMFNSLPEVLQLLLDNPDSKENLYRLAEIKSFKEDLAPVIQLLMTDVFFRNRDKVHFGWPELLLKIVGRTDYLSGYKGFGLTLASDTSISEVPLPNYTTNDCPGGLIWASHVASMRVFQRDRRLEEVCRMLDSSTHIVIQVERKAEMSDQDLVDEQERFLLQRVQIAFAAPVGRAAFTLRTEEKSYADLTSVIFCPKLCISGKCTGSGSALELPDNENPVGYNAWPLFHNSVAAALAIKFTSTPADAWFAFNKAKNPEGSEQAGMIFGFGLNGILKNMPPTLRHDHLAKENSFTTMSMLIGLAANLIGTGDLSTWKLISLHIGAMLPACTAELEIPKLATLVAPCALGLLFLGTHSNHIAKVLLGEISKTFSPLSVFAGSSHNNSATTVPVPEVIGASGDREAHSLCAGFGLGFVSLGKGRLNNESLMDDSFDGILRRFVVGGPKPAAAMPCEDDLYNQYGQTLPSLWEEYRCCHIEEGENVNVDVTSPSAIVAVALIYLRSGNEAVLTWLSPPNTLHQLDGVRPDLLTLRSLASVLVFEELEDISISWLEDNLMPNTLQLYSQVEPDKDSKLDHESINQAWASIICGYCLGIGIRFAGTSDSRVTGVLWHYTRLIKMIAAADSKLAEYFPKHFLDSCVCTLLISLALVQAGTGDVRVLCLARHLQYKISSVTQTATTNFYGLQMCISMATGILFLGGGRYSLSNDDKSIAVILAAVFPKWPTNATDNRYHLQALRHLYVLAAQPRLILPRPMPHGSDLIFHIEYHDGQKTDIRAPVLLPPLHLLKKIWFDDKEYFAMEFNLPQDLYYLQNIVESSGVLQILKKPIGSIEQQKFNKIRWKHNFMNQNERALDDPIEEKEVSNSMRDVLLLGGWNNVDISPMVTLNSCGPTDMQFIISEKILRTWTDLSRKNNLPTCLRNEEVVCLPRNPKSYPNTETETDTIKQLTSTLREIKLIETEVEKRKESRTQVKEEENIP